MEFLLNNTLNLTVNEVNDEEIPWNIYLLTYELTRRVNMLASIGIILTGLLGNGIIMFVFSQKRFRTNSSNVYLLSLAIVDSIYRQNYLATYTVINKVINSTFFRRHSSFIQSNIRSK